MIVAFHDDHFFGDDHMIRNPFGPDFGFGFPEILFGLLFFALQVAFWVAVVVIVVRLIRGRGPERPQRASALHVLEERYARGEITREEFTERRSVLLGREPPPRTDPPAQAL